MINYGIKAIVPVRYKHDLTGGNQAITGENVY